MTSGSWLLSLVVVIILAVFGGWYLAMRTPDTATETPAPVATSTPTAPTPSGPSATYLNASADRIVVTSPLPGATVANTFTINGRARGGWYFEASFPLQVVSATGTVLKEMPVQANGTWMTSEFVPFATTTVAVPAWYKGPAKLVLKNDNASGLPENDASITIPITIQ